MANLSTEGAAAQDGAPRSTPRRPDRRARRRQETIAEILDLATDVMTTEGVNGLSLAEIARRLGVQPPSLYKYFPSLMAIYNELFRQGANGHGFRLPESQGLVTPYCGARATLL